MAERPSRGYVLVMLLLVAMAVAAVEYAYSFAPVPPGPDTGKWIATSYAYIGHPYPAQGSFANPYSYPPLNFPLIGLVFLVTGSPLTTGFVYGGFLLALYGLSLIHLARRYLLSGPLQVGMFGVALFNGTTLSMLFWGGYPNFLAFVFLTEAMVFLLAFVRSKDVLDALVMYGMLGLLYLTHDLTFAVGIGILGLTTFVLLLHGRISYRLLISRANLAGVLLLGGIIGAYAFVSRLFQIPHPGYLFSNPAAYVIDNIGEIFNPVTIGCSQCPGDNLPIPVALAILIFVPIAMMALLFYSRNARVAAPLEVAAPSGSSASGPVVQPRFVDLRLLIASAWLSAACIVPVVGWFAHVDTDYTRFGYFFPAPVALFLFLLIERATLPWLVRVRASGVSEPSTDSASTTVTYGAGSTPSAIVAGAGPSRSNGPVSPDPEIRRRVIARRRASGVVHVAVGLLVVILVASSFYVVGRSESNFSGINGDAGFLATLRWLKASPVPGSVLTYEGHTAHWIEAVTARDAYFPGPTWIHFYPYQILRDDQSYWALNSRYAITNNLAVVSYSGVNDVYLNEMPMYSVYIEGIVFPVLRIDPSSFQLSLFHTNATGQVTQRIYPVGAWGVPSLQLLPTSPPTGELIYTAKNFTVTESSRVGTGGEAWINFTVLPTSGNQIQNLTFNLTEPLNTAKLLKFGTTQAIVASGGAFWWNTSGRLGQLSGSYSVHSTGTITPAPSNSWIVPKRHATTMTVRFTNLNLNAPLALSIHLATAGTSNPAIQLPSLLDTLGFLLQQQVRFVVIPTLVGGGAVATLAVFENVLGFSVAYSNGEWTVLEL